MEKIGLLVEERKKVISQGEEVALGSSLQAWNRESSTGGVTGNNSQVMFRSSTCLAMNKSTVVANEKQTLLKLQ